MDAPTVSLITGILTFAIGIGTLIYNFRRFRKEARSLDADAFDKFQSTLTKLQDRNDQLYQENVALEKKVTETERTNSQLIIRLEERDAQLHTATRQLDLLRDLAKTSTVNETLQSQLGAMNTIVTNLQSAQNELTSLMSQREDAYKQLFDSQRLLLRPQTSKTKEP